MHFRVDLKNLNQETFESLLPIAGAGSFFETRRAREQVLAVENELELNEKNSDVIWSVLFADELTAGKFIRSLPDNTLCEVLKIEDQDWNKTWRDSYEGVSIAPYFEILPVWKSEAKTSSFQKILMNPSLGFGTGEHPTTQLCLQAIGRLGTLKNKHVLDFGSGSGILSVAAALRGATAVAVEIDPLARESSLELIRLNRVENRIRVEEVLPEFQSQFDVVVANILRNVLVKHCEEIIQSLTPGGVLLLSGLLDADLLEVKKFYETRFQANRIRLDDCAIFRKDGWGLLSFKRK